MPHWHYTRGKLGYQADKKLITSTVELGRRQIAQVHRSSECTSGPDLRAEPHIEIVTSGALCIGTNSFLQAGLLFIRSMFPSLDILEENKGHNKIYGNNREL